MIAVSFRSKLAPETFIIIFKALIIWYLYKLKRVKGIEPSCLLQDKLDQDQSEAREFSRPGSGVGAASITRLAHVTVDA
jgi:hypothetical protein